jgi:hypothetical protein
MFSQRSPSLFLYLTMIIALTALVSCSGSQSEVNPCDSQEGNCIFVSFDGTNCEVTGPTDNQVGEYTVIFSNQSEGEARVEVAWLVNGKTIQDLEEDTRDRPTGYAPLWAIGSGFWEQAVDPGETVTRTTTTPQLEGDYGVLCFRIPQYAIFGGGFTLVK